MARIPDTRTIRHIPSGAMPIATYTPQIPQIGEMVSGFIAEESDRRSRSQLAKAEADFRIMKAKQDAAYDRDEEYGTITERYGKEMTTGLGSLATSITDPEVRQLFVDKYRPQVETGKIAMDELAWGKEKDFERAGLQERLDALDRGGLESGDIIGTNEAATALIESAAELDHLTEQERVAQLKGFKDNLAVGRLGTMEAEDRVIALKQPWAKNLPADTRAQLQREAMGEVRSNKAVGIVDSYMGKGLDIGAAMAEAQSIKDPKLRKEVESRFQYDYGMEQKAEAEQITELRDKYYDHVALGETTVEQIRKENPEDWEAMDASVQSSLIAAQKSSAASTKVPFSLEHHDKLIQLKTAAERGQSGAGVKLRKYFIEHAPHMSTDQQKTWSTTSVTIEGVMAPEISDGLTDIQAIAARLPETADASKRRVLLGYMGGWRADFKRLRGKEPTDEDRTKAVDRAIIEYDTTWAWGGMKPVYQMTPEEQTAAVSLTKDRYPEAFSVAEQYFKESGIQPTGAQFLEAIDKLKDLPAPEAAETIGLTSIPGGGAAIGVTMPEGEETPPAGARRPPPAAWGPQGAVQQEGVPTTMAEVKARTPSLYKRTMALFEEVNREPSEAQFMDAFEKVVAEMKD